MNASEIVSTRVIDAARERVFQAFADIEAPARIVMDHLSGPRFRLIVGLAGQGGRTAITWTMRFESAAERDRVARFAVAANEQNFDRLQAVLATTP